MPNWLSFSTANDMITAALLLVLLVFGLLLVDLVIANKLQQRSRGTLTVNGRCSAKGSFGDGNQGYLLYADRVILTCRL
jgi:hypothetical protein